jgi:glutamate-5-semialdehyde dehydrogenase
VKINGTQEVKDLSGKQIDVMAEDEFAMEYNDMEISIKLVKDVDEAIAHINYFGSHHTDCILTENDETATYFMQMVDSAGVYRNRSTRFADGFRYGFGAEVGISTGKLHARGPVGLDGLVTYKYVLNGKGHIVDDYSSGRKKFDHKDL